MSQLSITAAGPETDPALSQWFSPPAVAAQLVCLAADLLDDTTRMGPIIERSRRGCWAALSPTERAYYERLDLGGRPLRILEPSAGRGNLVRAIRARAPGASIDAVELDPRWAHELRVLGGCRVHEGDYLERPAPAERYDLAVVNPPYDGGGEADHLAKLMDECERICALLPSRSLHGRERYARVWRRLEQGWHMRQLVHLIARPKFSDKGGTDEIVLVDLQRLPGPCRVGWL